MGEGQLDETRVNIHIKDITVISSVSIIITIILETLSHEYQANLLWYASVKMSFDAILRIFLM
jgi:hypothetical protein